MNTRVTNCSLSQSSEQKLNLFIFWLTVTASKPPKAGSVSPVPPPSQFANESSALANQKFQKSEAASFSQSAHSFSSKSAAASSHSSSHSSHRTGVRVLPPPNFSNKPIVQFPKSNREPLKPIHDHVDSINSYDADQFIEQLMKEAETDPKLRELTYGRHQNYSPMVQNYRPAQDHPDAHRSQHVPRSRGVDRHQPQPERPYRSNDDMKIINNRSQSADGRLNQAFKRQDPKLSRFRDSSESNANNTEMLLNEVVTDKDHHSVRDLVNMMENNIKSESLNPYVRKWGCDLISPEPHKKNVTYRLEKKELVDYEELNRTVERNTNKVHTWQQDDHFKRKYSIDQNDNMILNQHQSPSGRGDPHDPYLEERTTELEELLHRRPSIENNDEERTLVVWPPPSPLPPPDQNRFPSPILSPSPPPPVAVPLPPRTPSPLPVIQIEAPNNGLMPPVDPNPVTPMGMPKKSNLKKRSQSEGGNARRFSNSSLHEMDQQIVRIQNEFEAELDTLIDTYRTIQHSSRKTKGIWTIH